MRLAVDIPDLVVNRRGVRTPIGTIKLSQYCHVKIPRLGHNLIDTRRKRREMRSIWSWLPSNPASIVLSLQTGDLCRVVR
jgi:hypothetical protein